MTPPHGGRRPGAGAPPGNLNAVRTGVRSRRLAWLMRSLDRRQQRLVLAAIDAATAARRDHAPTPRAHAAAAVRALEAVTTAASGALATACCSPRSARSSTLPTPLLRIP